jgi:hypothetical protein
MQNNHTFFKLKLLKDFLKTIAESKQILLNECIEIGGTDPVILMRRFRMLSQLCQYESDIINKINNFEITSFEDVNASRQNILSEVNVVTNRSA